MAPDSQGGRTDRKLSVYEMRSEGCGNWRQLDLKEPQKSKATPLRYKRGWEGGVGGHVPYGISQVRFLLGASGTRLEKLW